MGFRVEQINSDEIIAGKHTYRKGFHQTDLDFNCDWVWQLFTNPNSSGSFRFHTSWDWLRPVIDEIYKHSLAHSDQVRKVSNMKIIVDIRPAWQAVVDFITWYNNQTK